MNLMLPLLISECFKKRWNLKFVRFASFPYSTKVCGIYSSLYKLGVQEIFLDECGIHDVSTEMLNALGAAVFKGIESGFRYLNSIRLESLP